MTRILRRWGLIGGASLLLVWPIVAEAEVPATELIEPIELIEPVDERTRQVVALIGGEFEPGVDVDALLSIALTGDTLLDGDDLRRIFEVVDQAEGEPLSPPSELERPSQDVTEAKARLVQALAAWLSLEETDRHARLSAYREATEALEPEPETETEPETQDAEVHAPDPEAQVAEAEEAALAAAREKEAALAQARAARTEALRKLAEERARLLGVKEAQALFDVELAERRVTATEHHEAVASWEQRVSDVIDATRAFAPPAEDPDGMYPRLREELQGSRARLGEILHQVVRRTTEVPLPGALESSSGEDGAAEIRELHRELVLSAERLVEREKNLRWELADGYRDDIVGLNTARLLLLGVTSESLRDALTGFGSAGVRQISGEIDQIGLELRYRGLSLPRHLVELGDDLRTSPLPLLIGLLQLIALVLVFRWWRRRAPALLALAPSATSGRRSRASAWLTGAAWYASRIRKPLEWLAVAAALYYGTTVVETFPELEFLWLVVLWLMLGSTAILVVDAIAAREHHRQGGPSVSAAVRIRSLRLIGRSIAYTGLVLSITDAFVGEGAIYAWVLRAFGLLAIPIALLLTHWWKDDIVALFAKDPPRRLSTWVRSRTRGIASYPVAMIGGLVLLARGTWRWLIRRAARFEGTRHLLAYFFRRKVAKQAEVTGRSEHVEPANEELRARFVAPMGPSDLIEEVAHAELDRLKTACDRPGASFCMVVGERGIGKSTLLARLCRAYAGESLVLQCPATGLEGLVASLCHSLELPRDTTLEDIARTLGARAPLLVTIDDIQRLIQPTIGGMHGLDELGRLARLSGADVSWVGAIGAAAWQYVERARGDQLHFNEVLRLSPWDETKISTLMRHRCELLEVEPSFEGLVIPRQYDDDELEEGRRSEIGYNRILWDYAGGNPYVASWFWAESLFCNSAGKLVVRLFHEPPPAELDALALTLKFVLRTLVQLEAATKPELAAAIRMPMAEVEDVLRFALGRGYVAEDTGVFSITWPWYRAVTRMLQRQHLLAA